MIVSGAPGAGKSTLAAPLAAELGFGLVSKDVIKETLFDAVGDVSDDLVATSDLLDDAALALLWRMAADSPGVVLEANLKHGNAQHVAEIRDLAKSPVEVYCRVPPELALNRYDERGRGSERHRVHYLRTTTLEILRQYQEPLGVGHVIEVDTTQRVDVMALAQRVRSALGG